jgi:hypothetical protein
VLAALAFAGPQAVILEHGISPRYGIWRENNKAKSGAQLHSHAIHTTSTKNRDRFAKAQPLSYIL